MEADNNNNQSIVNDSEHSGTKEPLGKRRKRQDPLDDVNTNLSSSDNSFNVVEEVRKMQEEVISLRDDNGKFRAENETLKVFKWKNYCKRTLKFETEKKSLAAQVEMLKTQNGELQVKQKVVELEAKQHAMNEIAAKLVS